MKKIKYIKNKSSSEKQIWARLTKAQKELDKLMMKQKTRGLN